MGMVKLACPACGSVVFEPQNYLDNLSEYRCGSCGRNEPVAVWKTIGLLSKTEAAWWVEFYARMSRSKLLAAEIKARAQAVVRFYAGGFSA
jgi:DNA-directed RNA polymerase subunit RPC12/RpoP